jgi:glycosyltransferase involved in cell wall biosynthesis
MFLFFGNPREEKGLDLLISALSTLKTVPGWRLVIAGKMRPAQLQSVEASITREGLVEQVRIDARHVPDDETVAYYRASDLVVVPYRAVYESGVTIMAMSLQRAVLVSDLEPLVEKIKPGKTGLVCRRNDVESLAASLREAVERRSELDDLGAKGYQDVLSSRGWSLIGTKMSDLVQHLIR